MIDRKIWPLVGVFLAILFMLIFHFSRPEQKSPIKSDNKIIKAKLTDHFWQEAEKEVDKSTLKILSEDRAELRRGLRRHKFIHGDINKKVIALTFDDGPHPEYTPKILAILKNYDAKASFFLVGKMAEKYPELVRAEVAAGHTIGNHTYDHVNLTKIPSQDVATEIDAAGDVIESITGKRPFLFRPPGGDYNRLVSTIAEALGYTFVLWTDNAGDWASPGQRRIESKVLRNISNGGVILLHDGIQQTIDVLPQILEILKKDGYQFATVDQMMSPSERVTEFKDAN